MINVRYSPLAGSVDAIPSKSYAHRALFLAALANEPTVIFGKTTGIDTDATINVLRSLGADIRETPTGYEVSPIAKPDDGVLLNVRESGSTLRFLLPLVAFLGVNASIIGEGRLADRPNEALIRALENAGASFDGYTLPLSVSGKANAETVYIQADVSSQFVSGLLMSMQTLPFASEIKLIGELKSKNYVDITLDCMKAFGATVEKTNEGFLLSGGGYVSPKNYAIEGDWSNSAFWLVAGAIGGKITVNNLNADTYQGDKAVIDILKKANAKVTVNGNSITVEKSVLKPFSYDMEDVPDLVPITAVLASSTDGKTLLTSVERLRFKESDRIRSTINLLTAFGITAFADENGITVVGGKPERGIVDGANDHRIVMSACILGSITENGIAVGDEKAVEKSYKNFYKDFKSLGGIIDYA